MSNRNKNKKPQSLESPVERLKALRDRVRVDSDPESSVRHLLCDLIDIMLHDEDEPEADTTATTADLGAHGSAGDGNSGSADGNSNSTTGSSGTV